MVSRKGSLLERNVANIFGALGFHVETNVKKKGYEIDVLAKKGDYEVIIECKQYEASSLTIRNLIHQWADKNSEINANKVILVLYGMHIKDSDKSLALNRNIILWDETILQNYTNLIIKDKQNAYDRITSELNITSEAESAKNIKNIDEAKTLVMQTLLSGKSFDEVKENELYGSYISSLKSSLQATIRANLSGTLEQNKRDYAELFSQIEKAGSNNKSKWEKIKEIIKTDNELFPVGKSKQIHLNAIKKIEDFFEQGKQYFNEKDKKILRHKLVKTALEWLRSSRDVDTLVFISKQNKFHDVMVSFDNDDFHFQLDKDFCSADKLEKLKWIIDEDIVDSSQVVQNIAKSHATVRWSLDNDISKATKYVENVFELIYEEDKDFDIVLKGLYEPQSWVAFWIFLILGLATVRWLIGFLFLYLVYREYKKHK